ncbi:MAG: flagellar assembly protein FliW [Ruminococcus sp.]|nr:flagellar assembly protein FliW [Ruminococcus sp.]
MNETMEKITVKTRDFDEIQVSKKDIITFPNGIFAFEEYRDYILLTPLGEGKFPVWLQSTENPNLCFILFNPLEFCPEYRVTVADEDVEPLEMDSDEDSRFYVISVIPENYMDATVNLKSPIIVNSRNNKAVQVIVADDYPIKFPVFAKGA